MVATIDFDDHQLISGPDIVSRGFVYVRESEELMEEARQIATTVILDVLDDWDNTDRMYLKKRVRDELARFVYTKTKRKPMILPVIMNI